MKRLNNIKARVERSKRRSEIEISDKLLRRALNPRRWYSIYEEYKSINGELKRFEYLHTSVTYEKLIIINEMAYNGPVKATFWTNTTIPLVFCRDAKGKWKLHSIADRFLWNPNVKRIWESKEAFWDRKEAEWVEYGHELDDDDEAKAVTECKAPFNYQHNYEDYEF